MSGPPAGVPDAPDALKTAEPPEEPAPGPRPPAGEHPSRLGEPDGPGPLVCGDARSGPLVCGTAQPGPLLCGDALPDPHVTGESLPGPAFTGDGLPGPTAAFELPALPPAVGTARRVVRDLLTVWGVAETVRDDAALVLSELVTNALVHAAGERVVCRVRGAADRVRLEIEDQNRGRALPFPRKPGPDEQNGRGLFLVAALSDDWGVTLAPGRPARIVWAELPTAPPASEADADIPLQGDSPARLSTTTLAPAPHERAPARDAATPCTAPTAPLHGPSPTSSEGATAHEPADRPPPRPGPHP
ncbi:ATP-binding protein [Streptomyces collinus]|uniref:ATP-binding protein n=1 Tax=Streptomyces collinus TaxID=42684 RepID=UPI002943ACD2|nr:ATP-binding protein [Streptomyces collinus]